ncbi:MAG: hypothetical protein ACJAYN_003451 [Bermanella sp.]|jgi:hypothetical protein|uniref:hypothetical protein n=1 Tax=Glaciecola sp. 33A TaxID=2057807 RepID=UPI000C34BDB1|nr:hypothetical protein [Glaciecola sp. 33A]PKI03269.1 hypothetical protein CXF81_00505 [Glaciecola sp. 33A]
MSDKKYNPLDEFKNKKNVVWVIMSASMCIFILFALFSGAGVGVIDSVYSVMLWCGLFAGIVARYIGKNGWIGFGIGSVFGLLCFVLAPVISSV